MTHDPRLMTPIGPEAVRRALAGRFGQPVALVVGDVMLDRHLDGPVLRRAPEAPVPVLRVSRREEAPGGAGNAARNLAALGARVTLCAVVGTGDRAGRLRRLLAGAGVRDALVAVPGRSTTSKSRILNDGRMLLRLDEEEAAPLPEGARRSLEDAVRKALERRPRIILLSDYAKGALSPELCRWLVREGRAREALVVVDPKCADPEPYAGASVLTPNEAELAMLAGLEEPPEVVLLETARRLRRELGLGLLLLTRGPRGLVLVDERGTYELPPFPGPVRQVAGAGDTVAATFACALHAGLAPLDAARLAGRAAAQVIASDGTSAVDPDGLAEELERGW